MTPLLPLFADPYSLLKFSVILLDTLGELARIYGLGEVMAGEMLLFEKDVMGEVFNLEEDSIAAVINWNVQLPTGSSPSDWVVPPIGMIALTKPLGECITPHTQVCVPPIEQPVATSTWATLRWSRSSR